MSTAGAGEGSSSDDDGTKKSVRRSYYTLTWIGTISSKMHRMQLGV